MSIPTPTMTESPHGGSVAEVPERPLLAVGMVVAIAVSAVVAALALLAAAIGLTPTGQLHFVAEVNSPFVLRPEPVEQQVYLLIVAAAVALPFAIAWAASRPAVLRRVSPGVTPALEFLIAGLVVAALIADPRVIARFLPAARDARLLLPAAVFVLLVILRRRLVPLSRRGGRVADLAAGAAAALATTLLCLAGFYTDGDVIRAPLLTGAHIPYTFEEIYAVAGGHTSLVDFTAQYDSVLPYLLAPFLALRPFSVAMFTATMVSLSVMALMFGYVALRLTTGSAIRATAFFLPAVALALLPVVRDHDQVHSVATYFAVMPMRYLLPFACLGAVAVFARLEATSDRVWVALGVLGALTLLNNLEFGLPAAVGLVLAALGGHPPRGAGWRRQLARRGALMGAGGLGAVLAFTLLTLARSGSLPELSQLAYFSRQFAASGFLLVPIDTFAGLPELVMATFVVALALGLAPVLLGRRGLDPRSRVRTAVLTFTGTFGLGAMAYWVGRTVDEALIGVFPAWAFALAAVAAEGLRTLPRVRGVRSPGAVLAVTAVAVFLLVGSAALVQADYGLRQPARVLKADGGALIDEQRAAVAFAKRCIAPGTDTGMIVPFGLRVADEARVHDWFPYNAPISVVTYEQVDRVFDVLDEHHADLVLFGQGYGAITAQLERRGFRPVATAKNPLRVVEAPSVDAGPVLTLWGRGTASGLRCAPGAY